jgi:hypothetical protein
VLLCYEIIIDEKMLVAVTAVISEQFVRGKLISVKKAFYFFAYCKGIIQNRH